MILVNLYNFSKSINSTKQPSGAGTQYECQLKDDTSIINPVLIFSNAKGNPFTNNYAYIVNFSRYYTITDWTWVKGLWYATLSVDTLATYKEQIGASTQYIIRSASDFDGRVVDNMYPIIGETDTSSNTDGTPWDIETGDYVVGVMGGAGSYYAFSKSGLANFFNNLYDDDYLLSVVGIDTDLETYPELRTMLNPLQYISGITYIPRQVSGSSINAIKVGWGGVVGVDGAFVDDYLQTINGSFSVPQHPQSNRGEYLNLAPFTEHSIFFPPYGYINLDSSVLSEVSSVTYEITYDVRTGDSTLTLSVPRHILTRLGAKIGVNVQQTQSVSGGYSIVQGAARYIDSSAGGFSIANPVKSITGAAVSALSEVGSAYAGQIPSSTSIGSNGGVSDLDGTPVLQSIFRLIAEEDNAHNGRPLMAQRVISTIPGYILPSNPDVDTSGTASENSNLLSLMAGGFYYE